MTLRLRSGKQARIEDVTLSNSDDRKNCIEGFVVCGLWFVVCGLWFVVCGLWFVVCGLWFVVCGL